uniref:Tryptophan--tRNA ligase n=1 Tax=Candidatus Kentrum sp. FM TaxID=2126340 RepID=A0A450TPH3_9GAMM|nr:MAG: tryptophanyl-tRNA synthetase [Candidatus Kentron sp. FM]VFJ71860.1 MAG: tryptophanyl-tRNA synthetase [Candidatus Kentron sp. FM]VFK19210.1 MAG: tryptophanyl-tRNA synthetase [Candidatus Kentron sp. FM]
MNEFTIPGTTAVRTGLTPQRVLSGMRPTGRLHLGHYHGVLHNWVELQYEHECFFFVADWHALTTEYETPRIIADSVWEMIIDWLAVGVNPGAATLFIQSRVPEHAELHLLLSMITPLGWLERVPSYKDQQEKLNKELSTYGFLGYPLLQSADILAYRAGMVPVGEDQVAHVELTREVARRFNYLYGREPGFESRAEAAIKKLGKRNARLYRELRRRYQEQGDAQSVEEGQALLLQTQQHLSIGDRERLFGYLEGGGKIILPEPQPLLTPTAKVPGLDGQKMSKSYGNTIMLREDPESVTRKLRTMPTDPARVRRTDPGDPAKCPVWQLHQVYSTEQTRSWVQEGCRYATIGCLDCKQPVIDAVLEEQVPIQEKAREYLAQPDLVRSIILEGCAKARDVAHETLEEVRNAVGIAYR